MVDGLAVPAFFVREIEGRKAEQEQGEDTYAP